MRFVTRPHGSNSLVTTKGQYLNSKGKMTHHPKVSDRASIFVCVDGEGMTVDGEHRYVLIGVGTEQIANPKGLQWDEVFEFLYSQFKPHTTYVGFFLGYDFTQIFRTMPEDKVWLLLTTEGKELRKHKYKGKPPHPVQCDGWQFDILGMKRLRIRPKECECIEASCPCVKKQWMYICDAGAFFQTSFLKVIDPNDWKGTTVVSEEEYEIIREGKAARSTAVLDKDMRRYNALENEVLSRVMGTLDNGFRNIGIKLPPKKWFGPGQAAQAWLKSVQAPERQQIEAAIPSWYAEAARMSYYGGWFEIFMHGIIPEVTHEYDINSAYPHVISRLPCLLHGEYSYGEGIPKDVRDKELCLVKAKVCTPDIPRDNQTQYIGAMLHRDKDGRILRPKATQGWYWWHELQAARKAGLIRPTSRRDMQQIYKWVRYDPCDCAPPMAGIAELYLKRLEVGKKTPLGKAAKLVYNSSYGKFAQSIGDPIYGNPVYASLITSGCRTAILEAIATHPMGMKAVAMVATDAVYFLDPHPGLKLSDKLGEWDYCERRNLTLFKPGVYWDDEARDSIERGDTPIFKARGVNARDFALSIGSIDAQYRLWENDKYDLSRAGWPTVSFRPAFALTTCLQSIRRGKWDTAGSVIANTELTQSSDPTDKRIGLYRDSYYGRTIFRSSPYLGIINGKWLTSYPYEKRFGMEDPWSDEYRERHGVTPDGNTLDLLSWVLKGE